ADAHIDFIEYQRWNRRGLCCDNLDRQTYAREFSAGGDAIQALRGIARIGTDQKFDIFGTRAVRRDNVASGEGNTETTAVHRQRLQLFLDLLLQFLRGELSLLTEFLRSFVVIRANRF